MSHPCARLTQVRAGSGKCRPACCWSAWSSFWRRPLAVHAQPANDACSAATAITSAPFSDRVDTAAATQSAEDVSRCGCARNSNSARYTFTPAVDSTVSIDTMGSTYDTVLDVFAGSCAEKSATTCNDDSVGVRSRVSFPACAGVAYLVEVTSYCEPGGGALVFNSRPTPGVVDSDADGRNDCVDNCRLAPNLDQADADGAADACDCEFPDSDGDGIGDGCDLCLRPTSTATGSATWAPWQPRSHTVGGVPCWCPASSSSRGPAAGSLRGAGVRLGRSGGSARSGHREEAPSRGSRGACAGEAPVGWPSADAGPRDDHGRRGDEHDREVCGAGPGSVRATCEAPAADGSLTPADPAC